MTFHKFPSIESFAHVYEYHSMHFIPKKVTYGAKVKIHGTNAGVTISPNGLVTPQKRSQAMPFKMDMTPANDNAGFAAWVSSNYHAWSAQTRGQDLTIFGEWAGPGIQKKDAVTMLNKPYFFVFAAKLGDYMITSPKTLEGFIPDLDDILVLPWHSFGWSVNFGSVENCQNFAQEASWEAEDVGKRDPFIYDVFDVDGPGEGLVFMPMDSVLRDEFSSLTFKVKAERHRVKQTEKAASVKHELPEGTQAFVNMFVTPQRVEQAVQETNGGIYDKKKMGDFMKWIGGDIKKESVAELEELGVEWKTVAKAINAAAARAFLAEAEKIM